MENATLRPMKNTIALALSFALPFSVFAVDLSRSTDRYTDYPFLAG